MEEIAAMLRTLQTEVMELKNAASSSSRDAAMPVDVDASASAYGESEESTPEWRDVLKDDTAHASTEAARRLTQLLGNPPPLGHV